MKSLNRKSGVTLIELLIALAIIGILLSTAFAFFLFENKTFSMGRDQYSTQADLRIANDYIVKSIRYATSIELSTTNPSPIANTDEHDYIFLDGDTIVHSAYDGGGTRIEKSLGTGLLSTTSFWSKKNLNSQMVGINIFGEENGQNFDLQSNIALPNIELKKQYIADTTGAKTIKYKVDLSLSTPAPPPPPPPPPPEGEETFVEATVIVTSNNNREYRITLNSIPQNTTESGPQYTATFTVLSNSSYPLVVEQKLNATTYKLVGNYTFDVNGTDVTKEITD